jgi:hypothetical protein
VVDARHYNPTASASDQQFKTSSLATSSGVQQAHAPRVPLINPLRQPDEYLAFLEAERRILPESKDKIDRLIEHALKIKHDQLLQKLYREAVLDRATEQATIRELYRQAVLERANGQLTNAEDMFAALYREAVLDQARASLSTPPKSLITETKQIVEGLYKKITASPMMPAIPHSKYVADLVALRYFERALKDAGSQSSYAAAVARTADLVKPDVAGTVHHHARIQDIRIRYQNLIEAQIRITSIQLGVPDRQRLWEELRKNPEKDRVFTDAVVALTDARKKELDAIEPGLADSVEYIEIMMPLLSNR